MKKTLTIVMDKDVYDEIKKDAKRDNRSVSNFIEQTFKLKYFKNRKELD